MNVAVIQDGVVVNSIVVDSVSTAEELTGMTCVEYPEGSYAGIGWTYNGSSFVAPVTEAPPIE